MSDSRDQKIEAAMVGGTRLHNAPIHLADYNPDWPLWFAREEARIRDALGEVVVLLEHVGSTSVVGLAAKPRIDILLAVIDSSREDLYLPHLESRGYSLAIREREWHEHRVFKGPDTDVNLHVFSAGCVEIERMLGFRDWLRTHPEDRGLYQETKRSLAAQTWRYVQHYADAKSEVIAAICARAGLPPATRI